MKRKTLIRENSWTMILLGFATLAAYAASAGLSIDLEKKAEKEAGRMGQAPIMLQAAHLRVEEAKKLYEKKSDDELDLDAADEDELSPGGSATAQAREKDAEAIHYLRTAIDFDIGGRPLIADQWLAKAKAVQGVSKSTTELIAKEWAPIEKDRDASDQPEPKMPKKPVYHKKLNEALDKLKEARQKYGDDHKMRRNALPEEKKIVNMLGGLWSEVGYQAFLDFNPDLMKEAAAAVEKLGVKPGRYAYLWTEKAPKAYDNLKTFPRDESETKTPKGLADFGVKDERTIVVGELDWDAEDATACVEEALSSGATTVVFENKGSPWYVRTIKPRANQRLVFKKGVKILRDRVSRQLRDKSPMIQLKGVKNVILEGEGGPEDVYIGPYESLAEREKNEKDYGGSGIAIGGVRNCIIRNMTVGASMGSGVSFGGGFEIWIENVVLRDHFMQGMSACDVGGLYCRNVSFLDTKGDAPMCGIDFEPNYEIEGNYDCYFYDCTFAGNHGGALNWSSSSYFPVTAHFKRCHFHDQPSGTQITIFARCGVYMESNSRAPSKLVFEDIDMDSKEPKVPIVFSNANLFDVEVKGLRAKNAKPITYSLGRDYSMFPYYDHAGNQGRVSFKDVALEGPEADSILVFEDKIGTYSVSGLSGSGTMNGKQYDFAQFVHTAPESGLKGQPRFDSLKLKPPVGGAPENGAKRPAHFGFIYSGTWFSGGIFFRAIYYDNGWKAKRIQPNMTMGDLGLEKFPVAYSARGGDNVFKLESPGNKPFRVYFEVPPKGTPGTIKLHSWSARLFDASGKVVASVPRSQSATYLKCESAGAQREIWSLEFDGAAIFTFFAPFTGFIAERPEDVPRLAD